MSEVAQNLSADGPSALRESEDRLAGRFPGLDPTPEDEMDRPFSEEALLDMVRQRSRLIAGSLGLPEPHSTAQDSEQMESGREGAVEGLPAEEQADAIPSEIYAVITPGKVIEDTLFEDTELVRKFGNNTKIQDAVSLVLKKVGLPPPSDIVQLLEAYDRERATPLKGTPSEYDETDLMRGFTAFRQAITDRYGYVYDDTCMRAMYFGIYLIQHA